MPKKKKFIDKKKACTFQLIHRSQQDPLVLDQDAPQRILQPVQNRKETIEEKERRIEEQHKYGIYYNDDTNYLEFLKERSDNRIEWPSFVDNYIEERKTRFALPKEVFASTNGDHVGMLNKTKLLSGPDFELDPDVAAALEDPDDQMEELEDNFIELADGIASDQEEIEIHNEDYPKNNINISVNHESGYSHKIEEESTDEYSDEDYFFDRDEISRTRNTNENPSSSCTLPFKDFQQELLTKQMDKMLEKFDDLGNLTNDVEEVYGCTEGENEEILQLGEALFKSQESHKIDRDDEVMTITKNIARKKNAFKTECVEFDAGVEQKYDCQSTFSTYSRSCHLLKLPVKTLKIKVNEKTGIPKNVLGQKKLTVSMLNRHNEEHGDISAGGSQSVRSTISRLTALSIRDKNETAEEKRKRKNALKEYRQERRAEKKCNRVAFAAEQKMLAKERKITLFPMGIL